MTRLEFRQFFHEVTQNPWICPKCSGFDNPVSMIQRNWAGNLFPDAGSSISPAQIWIIWECLCGVRREIRYEEDWTNKRINISMGKFPQ